MDEALKIQVKHLREVEGLSLRQITTKLKIARKTVSRIIREEKIVKAPSPSILQPYERLIAEWYKDYPFLRATQAYKRLKSYGYEGCYETVKRGTQRFRQKKPTAFHELEFLPGEEGQADWAEWRLASGPVYGFVYILAWSRYAVAHFYPRQSLEFFLDGHLRAFREIGGVAHRHRYDNLRVVVLRPKPELQLNAQFLDFSRHFGFSIHICNPGKANEKGRIERFIRDLKEALRITPAADLQELNHKISLWLKERNQRIHRSTGRAPAEMLPEEKLISLPQIDYRPYRRIAAEISSTGFVEVDTNRYSVPDSYAGMSCEVLAFPDSLEVVVKGRKVATHCRIFKKHEKRELPGHREKLLDRTPNFKLQRILALIKGLGPEAALFLEEADREGEDPQEAAYQLFRLLKGISKETLLSAVREANSLHVHKVIYIQSLLQPQTSPHPVCPQDQKLLEITYKDRTLDDYDDLI
jgi:transposase